MTATKGLLDVDLLTLLSAVFFKLRKLEAGAGAGAGEGDSAAGAGAGEGASGFITTGTTVGTSSEGTSTQPGSRKNDTPLYSSFFALQSNGHCDAYIGPGTTGATAGAGDMVATTVAGASPKAESAGAVSGANTLTDGAAAGQDATIVEVEIGSATLVTSIPAALFLNFCIRHSQPVGFASEESSM